MNIFMAKPMATFEYKDDYEKTEAFDQCDPMVGLSPVIPDPHFDWTQYYADRG